MPAVPKLDTARLRGALSEEQPMAEDRRAALSVRASWAHVSARLQDHGTIETSVRRSVAAVEGMEDEIVIDMVLRHLRRCAQSENLRVHELAHLLEIVIGEEHATRVAREVVAVAEQGLEETWYEKKLRRQFGVK